MAYDMPEPCEFSSLSSYQKRFLWFLKEVGLQHHHHLSLNRVCRWGTTDDFATSFLHSSLFFTAFWDLANSRPGHSRMWSSYLFLFLPCLLSPYTVPCKVVLARPDERETWLYHCSLRLFTICLLYTSPSPRDFCRSRMPSSA